MLDVGRQPGIELHSVERHRAKPRKVRIAGPEVVDGDGCAVASQAGNLGQDTVADLHRRGLREFELNAGQRNLRVREGFPNPKEEVRTVDLPRADVERQTLVKAGALPIAEYGCDLAKHPVTNLRNDSGSAQRPE